MRIAAVALCATLSPTLLSAATPFSKDGEATVYLAGAYEKQFVLSFDAEMQPQQGNQSWSTLAITLLGGRPPSDSISIGLFPSDRRIRIFVSANRGATNAFRDTRLSCEHGCRLTLRGDVDAIVACVDGREISRWPRFEFEFPHPSVQLNGEVDALGDRLQAQLRPVVMQAAGAPIARPT